MSEHNAAACFICGHGNSRTLEEHHVVPRRLGGSDTEGNLYHLCGTCHNAVEEMYDDGFYERLGMAVDEVSDPISKYSTGETVPARESLDNEIDPRSEHINVQDWIVDITVNQIEDGESPNTEYCSSVGERVQQFVEDHREEIVEEYEGRISLFEPVGQYYDGELSWWDGGTPPVKFVYEHDQQATVPPLRVVNPEKNDVDGSTVKESDNWVFKGSPFPQPVREDEESPERPVASREAKRPELQYPQYYRLHCGHCHTVFSQYAHTKMIRHLKIKHGVDTVHTNDNGVFGV